MIFVQKYLQERIYVIKQSKKQKSELPKKKNISAIKFCYRNNVILLFKKSN